MIHAVAKAGKLSIIGVYPQADMAFPIGEAMNRNLTIRMGNCNHRKYIPMLIDYVRAGVIDPMMVLTQVQPLDNAVEAFKAFDKRESGWMKVDLQPRAGQAA